VEADIDNIYQSDFYRILDFKCRCTSCITSEPEYSASFCVSFVRTGNFLFNVFHHSLDSYNGCILVTKPGFERTVTHNHAVPDQCTILDFKSEFYEELMRQFPNTLFFKDNDLHSALVKANSELDFLHFKLLQGILRKSVSRLESDNLIMDILEKVVDAITRYKPDKKITTRIKRNHLTTIERAKEYIFVNFSEDISLSQLAEYCFVSPFHFSRIFKTFTGAAPHQFLLSIRLKNAEMLLLNTALPVADIAFASGFNSIEHFTAAFHQKYLRPPMRFRNEQEPTLERRAGFLNSFP
jgi:AraC family transcriptional regulator